MKKVKKQLPPDIGGQAVLDGVMMKSPDKIAIAVRRENGDIVVKCDPFVPISKKHKWMGLPFVRGAVSFFMMLGMGMSTLDSSTKMSGALEEEPSKFELWLSKKLGKGIDKIVMAVAILLAVVLSFGLFVLLPTLPTAYLTSIGWGPLEINLVSGVVRIILLISYIALCGRVPEMRKTFRYHGSEHKTVYCNEHNLPLTVENVQKFSTLHPRCGTSFLLITFILAILLYTTIDYIILAMTGFNIGGSILLKLLRTVILLPLVTGVSYEVLKGLAHSETKICKILRYPGMMLQKLTTAQPYDDMVEVAIASMNAAIHGLPEGERTPEGWVILKKQKPQDDIQEEPTKTAGEK